MPASEAKRGFNAVCGNVGVYVYMPVGILTVFSTVLRVCLQCSRVLYGATDAPRIN